MASVPVPEEAAGHLGAILLAFNREIFGDILDEAKQLAHSGQAAAAVLIAGTVLEYLERSPAASGLTPGHRSEIATWRQVRNQVAHGSTTALSVQQAQQFVDGIRQVLMRDSVPGESRHNEQDVTAIKGKYASVPTSSSDFIRRKREDLELEDCG